MESRKDGDFTATQGGVLSQGHIKVHPQSLKSTLPSSGREGLTFPSFPFREQAGSISSESSVSIPFDLGRHFTFLKMNREPLRMFVMSVILMDTSQSRNEHVDPFKVFASQSMNLLYNTMNPLRANINYGFCSK